MASIFHNVLKINAQSSDYNDNAYFAILFSFIVNRGLIGKD